jgi:hypothetical protein
MGLPIASAADGCESYCTDLPGGMLINTAQPVAISHQLSSNLLPRAILGFNLWAIEFEPFYLGFFHVIGERPEEGLSFKHPE